MSTTAPHNSHNTILFSIRTAQTEKNLDKVPKTWVRRIMNRLMVDEMKQSLEGGLLSIFVQAGQVVGRERILCFKAESTWTVLEGPVGKEPMLARDNEPEIAPARKSSLSADRRYRPRDHLAEQYRASGHCGVRTVDYSKYGRNLDHTLPSNCFGDNCAKGTTYYRSNITTAINDIKGVHISNAHYRLLDGTPFFAFIKAVKELDSYDLSRMMKKNDEAIRCVMSRYDKPSGSFVLCHSKERPNRRDLESTFGIENGLVPIPATRDDAPAGRPPWLIRCYPGIVQAQNGSWKFSKKNIMDKMQEICHRQDETSVQDMVRLLNCFALASVFAPKQNASISSYLAHYAEDIQNMKTYDWACYILDLLFQQMNDTRNMKAGGCAIFLLFWLCERVKLVKKSTVFRQQSIGFLHWDLCDLYEEIEKHGLDDLKPTMLRFFLCVLGLYFTTGIDCRLASSLC